MLARLLQPQEIEVYYVIPTIRRYFAQHLKAQGMPQKAVANLLMLRESTVSQYLHEKRASTVRFPETVLEEIKRSAQTLRGPMDVIRETQRLLRVVREQKALCDIHRQFSHANLTCEPGEVGCLPYSAGCL